MNSAELFELYFGADCNSNHLNDNINWCIQRGIPSVNFYYANPYSEFSDYMRNIGDVVRFNIER